MGAILCSQLGEGGHIASHHSPRYHTHSTRQTAEPEASCTRGQAGSANSSPDSPGDRSSQHPPSPAAASSLSQAHCSVPMLDRLSSASMAGTYRHRHGAHLPRTVLISTPCSHEHQTPTQPPFSRVPPFCMRQLECKCPSLGWYPSPGPRKRWYSMFLLLLLHAVLV